MATSETSNLVSAIELVGLSRAIIAWVIQMNKEGHYPYDSVDASIGKSLFYFILF